jgi:hypothetical protein
LGPFLRATSSGRQKGVPVPYPWDLWRLPDLANKNRECSVKFEFQINNK